MNKKRAIYLNKLCEWIEVFFSFVWFFVELKKKWTHTQSDTLRTMRTNSSILIKFFDIFIAWLLHRSIHPVSVHSPFLIIFSNSIENEWKKKRWNNRNENILSQSSLTIRQSHHLVISFFSCSLDPSTPRKSFSTKLITCRRICWHRKLPKFDIINHLSNAFFLNVNWNVSLAGWFSTWSLMKWLRVTHDAQNVHNYNSERERERCAWVNFSLIAVKIFTSKSHHIETDTKAISSLLSGLTHPRIQLSIPIISSLSVSIFWVCVSARRN